MCEGTKKICFGKRSCKSAPFTVKGDLWDSMLLVVMAEDDEGTGNVGGPVARLPARGQEWLRILSSVRCHLPRGWGTNPAEELKREAAAPGAGGRDTQRCRHGMAQSSNDMELKQGIGQHQTSGITGGWGWWPGRGWALIPTQPPCQGRKGRAGRAAGPRSHCCLCQLSWAGAALSLGTLRESPEEAAVSLLTGTEAGEEAVPEEDEKLCSWCWAGSAGEAMEAGQGRGRPRALLPPDPAALTHLVPPKTLPAGSEPLELSRHPSNHP